MRKNLNLTKLKWIVTFSLYINYLFLNVKLINKCYFYIDYLQLLRINTAHFDTNRHKTLSPLLKQNTPHFFKKSQNTLYDNKLLRGLMKAFVTVNISTTRLSFSVHHTWNNFFLANLGGGLSSINLAKFFVKLKQTYYLLFNLYYYSISVLYFSNIFFRTEIESLNWINNKGLINFWKYIHPFFTLKIIKIFNQGWSMFYMLRIRGYNIACIIDFLYHQKTNYYLRRLNFYTLAVLPVNYSSNLVDFAVPTALDSFFTQLFFVKFLLQVQKSAENTRFQQNTTLLKLFYRDL